MKKLWIIFLFTLLSSCGTFSERLTDDPNPAATRLRSGASLKAEVDLLAGPLIKSGETQGLAVGILTPDGKTHFFGYGNTGTLDKTGAPTMDTIFQLGSLTKVFVSSLYAILRDEGVIRDEDTIGSVLSTIPLSADASAITMLELATHTSGLPREPMQFRQFLHFLKYRFTGKNLYSYIDQEAMYDYLGSWKKKPHSTPNYEYSNIGYGLLAHLLEIKTKKSLPTLLEEKIFSPLLLQNTGFSLNQQQKTLLAEGHVGDDPLFMRRGTPIGPWDMGPMLRGTGGLYSHVSDLLVFARANLDVEKSHLNSILSKTHQTLISHSDEGMALGWAVQTFGPPYIKINYIHGMASGYSSYFGMDDQSKIAVVVLSNSFNWKDKIGQNLLLRLITAFNQSNQQLKF